MVKKLAMPQSRPIPGIGIRCHELRINDRDLTWRIVYRIESDAIVILEVFDKKEIFPAIVNHFVKAKVRHFDFDDYDAAVAWID